MAIGSMLGAPVAPQAPQLGRVIKRGPSLSKTASAALAISRGTTTTVSKNAGLVPLPSSVPKPLKPIAAFGGGGGPAPAPAPAPSPALPGFPVIDMAQPAAMAPARAAADFAFEDDPPPVTGGQSTFGGSASVNAPDWAWIVGGLAVLGAAFILLRKRKAAGGP